MIPSRAGGPSAWRADFKKKFFKIFFPPERQGGAEAVKKYIFFFEWIPYLSKLPFLTKKFKDFNDFKIICRTLYYRIHKYS